MNDLTTTPAVGGGQLPIDHPQVNAQGVTDIRTAVGEATKPAEGAQKGTETQPVVAPVVPPTGQTETTPAPRMFTEEEHNRLIETMKGGHKGTVEKLRLETAAANQRVTELESQSFEKEYSNWKRAFEEGGGDTKIADSLITRDKATRQLNAQLQTQKITQDAKEAELNEAAIGKIAYDLVKEHGLDPSVVDSLISSGSKPEMEAKALRLALAKVQADSRQPEKPTTPVTSGKGVDFSKMNIVERLGRAASGEFD